MKKASYRLLQWTMMMGATAILASACVVTSGDGDDDDSIFDGGEGGTSSTAGKTSTGGGGTTSTAGKGGSGGTAGTTAGTGGSTTAGTGGTGGTEPAYVPGVCEGGDEPTMLPVCDLKAEDEDADHVCRKCLKTQCCTEWKTCYGDTPTSACGWGKTYEADGQFDCIQHCYLDGIADAADPDALVGDCSDKCLNQCEDGEADMGFPTTITNDLLGCAQDKCLDDCFPAQ
jgi:hypothetical protein